MLLYMNFWEFVGSVFAWLKRYSRKQVSVISAGISTRNATISRNGKPNSRGYQTSKLVSASDKDLLCPIRYVYDYLPREINWLKPQPISLTRLFANDENYIQALHQHGSVDSNDLILNVQAAKFPIHTGLEDFRQCKHWRANERATRELLELFAHDELCREVRCSDKRSMASLAEEQLSSAVVDTYSRFSMYMFPWADETRIQLLAQSVILIFMFDDVWENSSQEVIASLRDVFVSRLQGNPLSQGNPVPLEERMSAIRQGFLDGDAEGGNGGAEVLQTLINFCNHSHPPPENFSSVRDYLDYRWEDIANSFTWSLAKFSIKSTTNQHAPHLHRFLRLLGDQLSIANDIASYDKELRRYETGRASSMINIVHVLQRVERVDAGAAKEMAFAWQCFTEDGILRELEGLRARGKEGEGKGLSAEEWRFVHACLLTASGNLLTSVVIARYGGEGARID